MSELKFPFKKKKVKRKNEIEDYSIIYIYKYI